MTAIDGSILWDPQVPPPSRDTIEPLPDVQLVTIKARDESGDGYRFHHGAALLKFDDELFCSFAANKGVENTSGETALYSRSNDDGRTWSTPREFSTPAAGTGISHGVFLVQDGELWAFHCRFGYQPSLPAAGQFADVFPDQGMLAYLWDAEAECWHCKGLAAENFWPNREPVRLPDGNWFASGLNKDFLAAVGLSHGDDLTRWIPVHPPMGAMRANEAAAWVDGASITLVMRNHTPQISAMSRAAVSLSRDGGRTWSQTVESNMPLSISKPYCGTLENGQRYLIGNSVTDHQNGRRFLTLALGRPGSATLSRMFLVRDLALHPSPAGDAEVNALCYPHAIELNGKLYIAHSAGGNHNQNNIDLAIVGLVDVSF